jgi:sugar lactone lactonase YvrE
MMFGPDRRLYAFQSEAVQIVAYDVNSNETVIADNVQCRDLAVTHGNEIYFTDPSNHKVWFIDANRQKRVVDQFINSPSGVQLTPDQSWLLVSDADGQFVYSFQILPDGSLTNRQRYFYLHLEDGSTQSGAGAMTVDTQGRLYVATEMGVQICDQAGRVQCILSAPHRSEIPAIAFGGANVDELYLACGDTIYKRKTKAKGVLSFQDPIKPPTPRL